MCKKEKNKHPNKIRKSFDILLTIFIVIISVIALGCSAVLYIQKQYLTSFWVNGQSMYPTLNKDVVGNNGMKLKEYYQQALMDGATFVDYGVMDEHKYAIDHLKRFDIVICNYSSDETSEKIKRVIGLPGETIKFKISSDETNGQLYVKNGDEFTYVEQPIDTTYIRTGSYPGGEIVLGDNEYFVCGDNRAHSSDSRSATVGPITKDLIIGKVVAICGYCSIYRENGKFKTKDIEYFSWPRFL